MKLVDAALAPEVNDSNSSNDNIIDNRSNKVVPPVDIKPASTDQTEEGSSKTTTTSDEASSIKSSTLQDAKVIRGTVEDLVSRQDKKLTFAEYLMQCLNDESNHDVLQWMPCGTQFTITNHRKFTMERMPSLFKIRNMSSFVRKLTRWGFNRVHEKETGNSDIFKHPLFHRDKPELCKKIRCVNRASQQQQQQQNVMYHHPHLQQHPPHHYQKPPMVHMMHHPGSDMMMGSLSESSSMRGSIPPGDTMHMISPRRSMGHPGGGGGGGPHFVHNHSGGRGIPPPLYNGPPPSHYNNMSSNSSRFPPQPQHTPGPPPGGRHHPRVSPEYEKEMIAGGGGGGGFPSRPPQVYSPPTIGRSMSAAAEYELEQVLLERQRARAAMYREQQQQQQQQGIPHRGVSPTMTMGNGSERSLGTIATGVSTGSRFPSSNSNIASNSHRAASPIDNSSSPSPLTNTTNSVVTAALETLQREGEYELDMSPREAMLRAVLHKRQQQRNQQQQQQQRGGPPPPRYDGPPPPVHYYR
jgi:HSF-type DNA-binding